MSIQIEKGVPIPPKSSDSKYPFQRMEVGDSCFIGGVRQSQISTSLVNARKRTGFIFTCRAVTENGVDGLRVWRTE